jgi:hypothetical protein
MRQPYERPQVTILGTVVELTQRDWFAPGSDFTVFGIDLGGSRGHMS